MYTLGFIVGYIIGFAPPTIFFSFIVGYGIGWVLAQSIRIFVKWIQKD